ncbi:MAG: ABC transporter permease [Microbacterium sp.]|nr:MAG: ABC transporter permease [Microbacterium sp.]
MVAGAAFTAALFLEAGEAQHAVEAQALAEEQGVGIVVIDNSGRAFTGSGCTALAGIPGVIASGKVYDARAAHRVAMPHVPFQVATVSPGFVRLMDPTYSTRNGGTYVLGSDFGSVLGSGVGAALDLVGAPSGHVGAILPESLHSQRHARWAFNIAIRPDDAPIRECWFQVAPQEVEQYTALAPALFRDAAEMRIKRLAAPDSVNAATQRYESRASRFGWIVAGVLMGVLAGVNIMLRRAEYALYSISGFEPEELALLSFIESTTFTAWSGVLGASAAIFVFALIYSPSIEAALAGAVAAVTSLSLSSLIGVFSSLWASTVDISKALKNRD